MKKAPFVLLILTSFLFSCSEEQDGDWDDNIGLSQKEVQFPTSEDSIVITTKQDGWWINEVSLNGTTDFEPTENSNGDFLLDENEFIIERRNSKELYIEMSPNTTGSERKLIIGLQNGNYFDGITIIQSAQNCNIGNEINTGDFKTGGIFTPDILLGGRYTLAQEGTLNSINLIGNGTGTNVQMAVYDDNSGVPNNLIATSSIGTVGNGVLSLPVTPILLPAGDYWIMAIYENEGRHTFTHPDALESSGLYFKELTFGSDIPTNASDFTSCCNEDHLYFLEIDCGNTLSIED